MRQDAIHRRRPRNPAEPRPGNVAPEEQAHGAVRVQADALDDANVVDAAGQRLGDGEEVVLAGATGRRPWRGDDAVDE
eukprot:1464536-Lingulodinium_polyedra.AAC.1